MTFEQWAYQRDLQEDWRDAVLDPLAALKDYRLKRVSRRKADPVDPAEWWKNLLRLAESGREKLLRSDNPWDLLKSSLGRAWGALKFLIVKVLHLPAMYKFFRHDVKNATKDVSKSGLLAARNPDKPVAWAAFGQNLINLAKVPVGAVMMGLGMKLSYQQYQIIQALGFTDIDLTSVATANVVACYALFVAFLVPNWLDGNDSRALRAVAWAFKQLFPKQMFDGQHRQG